MAGKEKDPEVVLSRGRLCCQWHNSGEVVRKLGEMEIREPESSLDVVMLSWSFEKEKAAWSWFGDFLYFLVFFRKKKTRNKERRCVLDGCLFGLAWLFDAKDQKKKKEEEEKRWKRAGGGGKEVCE